MQNMHGGFQCTQFLWKVQEMVVGEGATGMGWGEGSQERAHYQALSVTRV